MKPKESSTSCYYHPKRVEHLFYCYPFSPSLFQSWVGKMLCKDCKKEFDAQNWDYFKEKKHV